jgi:uncharacterized protein (TIGR02145 family)
MKKTSPLLLVLASWMLFSCTSVLESDISIIRQEEHVTEKVLTVKATIGENPETKTAVQSDGTSIFWTPGDAINLFYGTASAGQFTTAIESPALTTDFSGTLSVATGTSTESGVTTQSFWGVYPYNVSNTCTGDGVTLTIPSTQSGVAGSFADKLNPSVATSPGLSLAFYNVGSWFIFSVTQDDIVSVTLRGHNNEDLAGRVKVTMDPVSNKPVTQVLEGQKSITMTPAGGTFEVGESYYMVVIPGRMSSGLELTLTKSNGKQATWSINSDVTFTRSMYLRKLNADNGLTFEGREPLTITSIGSTTVTIQKYGTPDDITLEYRINNNEWTSYTVGAGIALADGESLQFRAGIGGNSRLAKSHIAYHYFSIEGTGTAEASGNIMSLLDRNLTINEVPEYGFKGLFNNCTKLVNANNLYLPSTTLADYCYQAMFNGCTGLTSAPELPATTLAYECYSSMFSGCTGLSTAPELPATTLAQYCYSNMFRGCTGLTSAPELLATTLAGSCYSNMFSDCTGLSAAPELPATTLAERCYSGMFYGCTGLSSAPTLPAATLAYMCYSTMFSGCTGLSAAPELPATTLAEGCYQTMFSGCTGLSAAPELPVTTLAGYCYGSMFINCTGLTSAPLLPATTLAEGCYSNMFVGCTGLTAAPELPATTLAEGCYSQMFLFCGNLSHITMLATNISASNCLNNWVDGVAATGSFVKNSSATWDVTGTSGVPYGWTVNAMPEAIDLGLPSGTKWASFNIGASAPEEYGNYYAWGEIVTKNNYYWDTYKWGSGKAFTKYNDDDERGQVDNLMVLEAEDDVANVLLGGVWRMPTYSEWLELIDNCSWERTTQNGVSGLMGTSNIAGFTNRSVFFPAGSMKIQNHPITSTGAFGCFWTSRLSSEDTPYADYFFYSGSSIWEDDETYRCYGCSVRPVYK